MKRYAYKIVERKWTRPDGPWESSESIEGRLNELGQQGWKHAYPVDTPKGEIKMYPNLYENFNWNVGVHRAPKGYEHPWLLVRTFGTYGFNSRAMARKALRWSEEYLESGDWA